MEISRENNNHFWKVAVIVDDLKLTAFQGFLLENLQKKFRISIDLVMVSKKITDKSNALENMSKRILFAGSEFLAPAKKKFFSRTKIVHDRDLARLHMKEQGIDVILYFADSNLNLDLAEHTRLGLLRYEFSKRNHFFEWVDRERLQKAELVHYFYKDQDCYKNCLKTGLVRRYFESLALHADGLLSAVSQWMSQVFSEQKLLASIENGGDAHEIIEAQPVSWTRRLLWQIFFLSKAVIRKMRRLFLFQKWNIAVVHQPITNLLDPDTKLQREWLSLGSSTQFVADPFPVLHDGQLKIFVENYDFRKGKGVVEAISINGENHTQNVEAIELPTHISYPSMIVEQGNLYCIPETLGENEVAIYQCLQYPNRWRKVKTLLRDTLYSDPTIFKYNDKWWMFATRYDRFSGGNDQLYAWHSDSLLGMWTPHAQNPIKVDVSSARSAGMPFNYNGVLYRPSQDCSRVYGGAVVMNRILQLSETEFAEEEVSRWLPDEVYPEGCHHIAGYGNTTVIDGRVEVFSWRAPFIKLMHMIRRHQAPRTIISNQAVNEEVSSQILDSFKVQTSW